jgi:hypothetical protein
LAPLTGVTLLSITDIGAGRCAALVFHPIRGWEKIMLMCWMRISTANQDVSRTIVQKRIVTA